jgi:hypothetical protein
MESAPDGHQRDQQSRPLQFPIHFQRNPLRHAARFDGRAGLPLLRRAGSGRRGPTSRSLPCYPYAIEFLRTNEAFISQGAEMPRHLGYKRRDAKKAREAAVCGRGQTTARRVDCSGRPVPGSLHPVGPAVGPILSFTGRRGPRPPPEDGRPTEAGERKISSAPQPPRARALGSWVRHARLDHGTHCRSDLAALPRGLFPRPCASSVDAAPRLEMAQTHVAPCEGQQQFAHLSRDYGFHFLDRSTRLTKTSSRDSTFIPDSIEGK